MQDMRALDAKVLSLESEVEDLKIVIDNQNQAIRKLVDTVDTITRIIIMDDDGK